MKEKLNARLYCNRPKYDLTLGPVFSTAHVIFDSNAFFAQNADTPDLNILPRESTDRFICFCAFIKSFLCNVCGLTVFFEVFCVPAYFSRFTPKIIRANRLAWHLGLNHTY
jgi:hypothetical protein